MKTEGSDARSVLERVKLVRWYLRDGGKGCTESNRRAQEGRLIPNKQVVMGQQSDTHVIDEDKEHIGGTRHTC